MEQKENLFQPPEYPAAMFSEFFEEAKKRAIRANEIEEILDEDYDLDRLKELIEADRDGRCVISPLASGDTIYFDAEDENGERTEEAYTVKDLRLYASVDMGYADWMIPLRDFDAKTCRRKEEEKGERDG